MRALTRRGLIAAFVFVVVAVVVFDPEGTAAGGVERSRAGTRPTPTFVPPVDAPVTDPFRAPATPYGPGNRGIEYGTAPGADVRAPADGVVGFTGLVGGQGYVAIDHEGGLRSTVGPLTDVDVAAGDVVDTGDHVGTAGGPTLLTVRRNGAYIDPAPLLADPRGRVRLVADQQAPPRSSAPRPSSSARRRIDGAAGVAAASWLQAPTRRLRPAARRRGPSRRVPLGRPWPPGPLGVPTSGR